MPRGSLDFVNILTRTLEARNRVDPWSGDRYTITSSKTVSRRVVIDVYDNHLKRKVTGIAPFNETEKQTIISTFGDSSKTIKLHDLHEFEELGGRQLMIFSQLNDQEVQEVLATVRKRE